MTKSLAMPTGLFLGSDQDDGSPVTLDSSTLLRHMMAIGSSGSGKTVLCKAVVEELALAGVPAICIDPQGDLCSLALAAEDPERLAAKGVDPALARAFAERADVVVLTPAARRGVPLCADPLRGEVAHLPPGELVYALSSTAAMLVSLLGYDLDSDDGEGMVAVIDAALRDLHDGGTFPQNLDVFSQYFLTLDEAALQRYERYLARAKIDQAQRRLARLDVGARRLLFHQGLPLDIDLLLGHGTRAAAVPGKVRVSVIYLNTLSSQAEKEFFIAAVAQQLYAWMLQHPSPEPQALFYIDEVAPFLPPVRKPACKPGLALLFKQARKYGVCCLMATQNPGDVDYKAMAQFGTWAIGRLTTRQDLAKVQPTVKSLDPVHVEALMERFPSQHPGELVLLAPDSFASARRLRSRWLYSEHRTLTEEDIEGLARLRWHQRFAVLEPPEAPPPAAVVPPQGAPEAPDPAGGGAEPPAGGEEYGRQLATRPSMSTQELAAVLGCSDSRARGILRALLARGLAGSYKAGRSTRYWALETGLRPDIGLDRPVKAMVPAISQGAAEALGETLRARKVLGFIGSDERLDRVELEYKVVLRLGFREKVLKPLWARVFGPDHELRSDAIYLHPRTLGIVVYDQGQGIVIADQLAPHASDIVDFDGLVTFRDLPPAELPFRAADWVERQPDETVMEAFRRRFDANPRAIEPVFLPVWQLHMASGERSGHRIVTIDALFGRPLVW